jgi:hypothetical protein
MNLEQKDIEQAAQITPEELAIINDTADRLARHEPRPLMLVALASHLIGIVVRGSEGSLPKELVVDLVAKGVEV